MIKYLGIFLLLLVPSSGFCFGFRRQSSQIHYPYQYYYYQPRIVEETYSIPIRELKLAEVRGLRILTDNAGNSYYELNGKILSNLDKVIEETTEAHQGDKIIITKKVLQ